MSDRQFMCEAIPARYLPPPARSQPQDGSDLPAEHAVGSRNGRPAFRHAGYELALDEVLGITDGEAELVDVLIETPAVGDSVGLQQEVEPWRDVLGRSWTASVLLDQANLLGCLPPSFLGDGHDAQRVDLHHRYSSSPSM